MRIEEVKEEFRKILTGLMKYDYEILREARSTALLWLETECQISVFLTLKHRDLFYLRELPKSTLVSLIFFKACWHKGLEKEIEDKVIDELVSKFTSAFKPTEYKDAIEEIKSSINRAINMAIKEITREEAK